MGYERINRSVYLGELPEGKQKQLEHWLAEAMKTCAPQDSLIILPVTQQQVWRMSVLGHNALDVPTITGDRHTLII